VCKTVQLSRLCVLAVAVLAADCVKVWRREEKMRGAPRGDVVAMVGSGQPCADESGEEPPSCTGLCAANWERENRMLD
jgi:hypothetical protein